MKLDPYTIHKNQLKVQCNVISLLTCNSSIKGINFPSLDSCLVHMICFKQWKINKCDTNKDLNTI